MRALAKALKTFVGGFGLPAYTVDTVPDDVTVPYLVYPLNEPEWDQKTSWYIQGWFRTTSNDELTSTADAIIKEIGTGITITTDSGYLVIYPETPLVQLRTDGDYRSFYISLSINVFQMPGAYPEPVETTETQPEETPEEGENR